MGCSTSKEDLAKYQAVLRELEEVRLDRANTLERLRKSEEDAARKEKKHLEQINLLRFKVEVLVNMLSMEEKKVEATTKRLDALKWVLLTQGINDKTIANMLQSYNKGSPTERDISLLQVSNLDLAGAIERLTAEMKEKKAEIVESFADKEGKIEPVLNREKFSRFLYESTEAISKTDAQILALRFSDGTNVLVADFLDYFTSSEGVRRAKCAASAVRASLNKLQLDDKLGQPDSNEDAQHTSTIPTHSMPELQKAIQKLNIMWHYVEDDLDYTFEELGRELDSNQIVMVETFQEELLQICGPKSDAAKRVKDLSLKNGNKIKIEWLTKEDVDILADRFELGGRVDVKLFFDFFRGDNTTKDLLATASPYRFSSEWASLKLGAKKELSNVHSFEEGSDTELDQSPDDAPQLAPIKPKQVDSPKRPASAKAKNPPTEPPSQILRSKSISSATVNKADMKETANKPQLSEEKPKEVPQQIKPKPPPSPTRKMEQKPLEEEKVQEPTQSASESNDIDFDGCAILQMYASDPQGFEKVLDHRANPFGHLFTPEILSSTLLDMCPIATDEEIESILHGLLFAGGTCSSPEVTELLQKQLDAMQAERAKRASTTQSPQGPAEKADRDKAKSVKLSDQPVTRAEIIAQMKLRAVLDPLTAKYKEKPREFTNALKESATDPKQTTTTLPRVKDALSKLIPNVPTDVFDVLENDLKPKIRPESQDILVTTVLALFKERVDTQAKLLKGIAQQEKEKAKEDAKTERMAARAKKIEEYKELAKLDTISLKHKANAKLIPDGLKAETPNNAGTGLPQAQLKSGLAKLIPEASEGDVNKVLTEVEPKTNRKNNEIPISAVVSLLNTRVANADKFEKLAQKEIAAQERDAFGGGGFGLCGGKSAANVHDPSKAPPQPYTPANTPAKQPQPSNRSDDGKENKSDADGDNEQTHSSGQASQGLDSKPPSARPLSFKQSGRSEDSSSASKDKFLPRIASNMTTDTLQYSDASDPTDRNSEDGSVNEDRRGQNRPAFRKAPNGTKANSNSSSNNNNYNYGRSNERNRKDSDSSVQSDDVRGLHRVNSTGSNSVFSDDDEDEVFSTMKK